MAAIAATPPAEPTLALPTEQLDAYQQGAYGSAQGASPDAIAKSVMSGLKEFSNHEVAAHANAAAAIKVPTLSTGSALTATDAGALGTASDSGKGLTTQQMLDQSNEIMAKNMSMGMEVYSFAMEATLISNAATTFTSSINNLIKTQ